MAKRAYFGMRGAGHAYLGTPAPTPGNVIEGIGTDAYKVSFQYEIISPATGSNIPEASPVIGNICIDEDTIFVEGSEGDITVSGISVQTNYLVEVERDGAGNVTIKLDGSTLASGVDNTDWTTYDTNAAAEGNWQLFSTGWNRAFYMIGDFQIWKNGVLVVNIPCDGSFEDVQSGLIFTNEAFADIIFCDMAIPGSDPVTNLSLVAYIGGGWSMWPQPTHYGVSGDVTSAIGASKAGLARRFILNTSIPPGSIITDTRFVGYSVELVHGGGTGYGGVGTKSKIFFHKDNASSAITTLEEYQTIAGSVFGNPDTYKTNDLTWDDVDISSDPNYTGYQTIDLSTIFQEVANLGEITSVTIFIHDHEGLSDTDKAYLAFDSPIWQIYPILTISYTETPGAFTVTYDGNGNTGGNAPIDSTSYNSFDIVNVLDSGDLEKQGFGFVEWNTSADGSGTSYQPNDTFSIVSNVTLYAIWATQYYINNTVTNNNGSFLCIVDHLAAPDREPGVGEDWRSFWIGYPALHIDLTDLQGGDATAVEFYHLTELEYNQVQANDHNMMNNLQGGDSTSSEYYHLTLEEHTNATSIATETTLGLSMFGTGLSIDGTGLVAAKLGFGLGLGDGNEIEVKLGDGLQFDGSDQVSLEIATDETLGGVIVGRGLSIAENGMMVVNEPQIDHNLLDNLQGGDSTSNDYYHLNEYEYNQVQANDHNMLNNLQGGDSTSSEFYHLTEVEYNDLQQILYLGACLLAEDGYQWIGKKLEQWGAYTTTLNSNAEITITFPVEFPNACFHVDVSMINGKDGSLDWTLLVKRDTISTTGVTIRVVKNGVNPDIGGFYWRAIGY